MSRLSARGQSGGTPLPGTPIPEGMTPEVMTAFHAKNNELHVIRKKAQAQMKRFNALKLAYLDWYKRQNESFIESLKTVQMLAPDLVPPEVGTIAAYRASMRIAEVLVESGRRVAGYDKQEQFIAMWRDYCDRKLELDELLRECEDFLRGVAKLRNPEERGEMLELYGEINAKFSEEFDFRGCHNEKDHLYTYAQTVSDQRFLGLVGYIPFLLGLSARCCHSASRLYIEKP